jgi:hypothetical protein
MPRLLTFVQCVNLEGEGGGREDEREMEIRRWDLSDRSFRDLPPCTITAAATKEGRLWGHNLREMSTSKEQKEQQPQSL